jgi:hypothetical protein
MALHNAGGCHSYREKMRDALRIAGLEAPVSELESYPRHYQQAAMPGRKATSALNLLPLAAA